MSDTQLTGDLIDVYAADLSL